MKKIYKTLLLAVTGILSFSATGQVSLYTFSQLSGTYTAITGGTVFGTPSSDDDTFVNPAAPATSGNTGVGIPIGFNFTFNSIVFDRFGINNNGWIGFGQSTFTPNAVNISNTGSNYTGISSASTASASLQHRVAGLSRDIQGNGTTSNLRVQTIGTTPNQVCVIQWSNYKKFGTNGTGDDFSFQIRLYETSNRVEVVYGTFINNVNASTAEVGLRGASNADFNNRITNTTNPWIVSIPGTVNTSAVSYNSAGLVPNTGQIYRWDVFVLCNGAPATNSVTSLASIVCPSASAYVALANSYSIAGLSYQWSVSDVSAVGPFTAVPTATNAIYAANNITVSTWYQVAVTCSVGALTTTANVYNITIAPTVINNVPYHEGFEGITQNNELPNCSWAASNLPTINQTYVTANLNNRIPHSGSKFAAFRFGTNVAGDYFYTNGVQLEPGITYSAAVWYITDGNLGWSELSINYGTSQTSSGLTSIASVTGAVTGQFYQLLSNTFTVPNSGVYYIAIRCKGNASPQFLTFDDLSVTIPCSLNSPSITLVTTPSNICSGQPVNITATGADSYSWSNGSQGSAISITPFTSVSYSVTGTNTLSGCSIEMPINLMVNPTPIISVFANSQAICLGSSLTLQAGGADTYTWSNGSLTSSTTVSPATSTNYTVLGSNQAGCIGSGSRLVVVNPLPNVTASSSAINELCVNETATLTGGGALNYQWKNNSIIILTQQAFVSPNVSTVYTLTGTDANGCSASTQVAISVSQCVGLNELNGELEGIKVYPNPFSDYFVVEMNNGLTKQIDVIDVTGRIILTQTSTDDKISLSTRELAAGVYYLKVSSANAVNVTKVVKD